MERLLDFANGDKIICASWWNLYLQQTAKQIAQLTAAVAARSAEEVNRLAHSCAGASSTCGMTGIAPLLRELERQGYEGLLPNAPQLALDTSREFDRIRKFLDRLPRLRRRRRAACPDLTMKKILIIEDDQLVANIYRNKFAVENYAGRNCPRWRGRL